MIVQISTGGAGCRTRGQSNAGVTRDRPNPPPGGSADGSATQGALFGYYPFLFTPKGPLQIS